MIGALLGFLLTVALSAFVAAAPGPQAYTRTAGAGGVTVKGGCAPRAYFHAAGGLAGGGCGNFSGKSQRGEVFGPRRHRHHPGDQHPRGRPDAFLRVGAAGPLTRGPTETEGISTDPAGRYSGGPRSARWGR